MGDYNIELDKYSPSSMVKNVKQHYLLSYLLKCVIKERKTALFTYLLACLLTYLPTYLFTCLPASN